MFKVRSASVQSYLITPVQRIQRYQLLLRELLKRFEKNGQTETEAYKELKNAQKKMEEVADYCNRKKKEQELRLKLLDLAYKYKLPQLIKPSRKLQREGTFMISQKKDVQGYKNSTIYLFNDMILLKLNTNSILDLDNKSRPIEIYFSDPMTEIYIPRPPERPKLAPKYVKKPIPDDQIQEDSSISAPENSAEQTPANEDVPSATENANADVNTEEENQQQEKTISIEQEPEDTNSTKEGFFFSFFSKKNSKINIFFFLLDAEEDWPLPEGWEQYTDDESGFPYYYNVWNGTTTWDRPKPESVSSLSAGTPVQQSPSAKKSSKNSQTGSESIGGEDEDDDDDDEVDVNKKNESPASPVTPSNAPQMPERDPNMEDNEQLIAWVHAAEIETRKKEESMYPSHRSRELPTVPAMIQETKPNQNSGKEIEIANKSAEIVEEIVEESHIQDEYLEIEKRIDCLFFIEVKRNQFVIACESKEMRDLWITQIYINLMSTRNKADPELPPGFKITDLVHPTIVKEGSIFFHTHTFSHFISQIMFYYYYYIRKSQKTRKHLQNFQKKIPHIRFRFENEIL